MNKNSRGFAPLIIVIVLTLIGLAGYIVFRSTDSTANLPRDEDLRGWKTFIGGGYSIKYPAHFQAVSDNNKDTILTDKGEKIIKISKESTTAKEVKEYAKGILFTKPTKINEYEAIEILNDVANAPFESYVLVRDGTAYLISNEAIYDENSENDKLFNQILSTFKFLDNENLYWISASRVNETQNLYVVVDPSIDLIPIKIEVIDTATNKFSSPYDLIEALNNPETYVCPNLFGYGKVYWTNNTIKKVTIPLVSENIGPNQAGNPLIYRLTLKDSDNNNTTVDIKDWGYYCESSAS